MKVNIKNELQCIDFFIGTLPTETQLKFYEMLLTQLCSCDVFLSSTNDRQNLESLSQYVEETAMDGFNKSIDRQALLRKVLTRLYGN